ncbi:hypothetical protein DZF91_11955 [Actinomadura logoneensis]|uniref:Uncharacterized protein n=1 Tax=Actinomadura logoneensis TaxID=2293572 RepID=A0A372JN29_9ACTN|nr:hypothetical protein [Actinomadura logoneensis]RFU41417.1 hypothetical protein DZF91_11955 [Actinomadura logoneensis]
MEFLYNVVHRQLTADVVCSCGHPVTHLAHDLLRLAGAENATRITDVLEGHVFEGEVLREPALPVAEICLAALTQDISPVSREIISRILLQIVSASEWKVKAAAGGRDIVQECREVVRRGTWLFYAEVFNCRAPGASAASLMILESLGEDPELLDEAYRVAHPALREPSFDRAEMSLDDAREQWKAKEFLRDEIERQLTEDVTCPCGEPAAHLGDDLLYLAEAGNGSPRVNAFEGHVFDGEVLHVPALPVARICMAALTQKLAVDSRLTFLDLLDRIVSCDSQGWGIPAGRDLVQEIKEALAPGLGLLYAEVFKGPTSGISGTAFMILQALGDNPDRLRSAYRAAYSMMDWVLLDDGV